MKMIWIKGTAFKSLGIVVLALANLHSMPTLAEGALRVSGGSDGGGGDVLRFTFEEGRRLSRDIVKTVDSYHWKWFGLSESHDKRMNSWFFDNQVSLAEALQSMKIEYRATNPNGFCAQTERMEGAVVYLSTEKCRGYTQAQATQQLMVEAAHHRGLDDQDADVLSINLMKVYNDSRAFPGPLWMIGSFGNPGNALSVDSTGVVVGTGSFSQICFGGHCYEIVWDNVKERKGVKSVRVTGVALVTMENLLGENREFDCQVEARFSPVRGDYYTVVFRGCELPAFQEDSTRRQLPPTETIVEGVVQRRK